MRAALATLAAALCCLALASQALADPPAHGRLAALDLTGLNHACGTAIDNKGDLYASSAEDNEIKVFDAEHNELTSIEDTEEPCALAVQTDGTLYVSERETGEVVRYEPSEYPPTESVVYGPSEVIDASGVAKGIAVDRADSRLYVAEGDRVSLYDAEGNLAAVNELQKVRVANATGGTFTLSFEGSEPTPSIPYNATPEELRAALEEIPALEGDVSVAKPAVAYLITFTGALGGKDVPLLEANASGLTGSGSQKVVVEEGTKGFSGHLGEGSLGEATGVAAYTYTDAGESARRLYLAVADAEADELKLFSGPTAATGLKLRRTISGVDADENPETPDQQFEFGAAGAYLSADPGNEGPAPARKCTQVEVSGQKQACTAGHLFLYDAGHGVVDELDAHGDFLDQLTAAGLADAGPTQVAVQRTGVEGDGTVYVSSGASTGAKLFAFGPLPLPSRELDEARSHVLEKAAAVAVDPYGYLYVAAQTKVHVYSPAGAPVVEFETPGKAGDLALDSKCRVYEVESGTPAFTYYSPSQCPPTPATTFARHEPNLVPTGTITGAGGGLQAVAVDPVDDHAFLAISELNQPGVVEFGSAEEGSPILDECSSGPIDIDVNAATGEIYTAAHGDVGGGPIYAVDKCDAEGEVLRGFAGGGCPGGPQDANPTIAIDQSNGHILEFDGSSAREYEGGGPCVAEFGSFKPTSGGYRVAIDNSCAIHEPPLAGAACEAFDPAYGTAYVAFDSTNKEQKYDVTAFKPLSYPPPYTEGEPPVATTGKADEYGPATITLHGTIDPRGNPVEECAFQYLTEAEYEHNDEESEPLFEGAEEEACAESPEEIGSEVGEVDVHASLAGLAQATPYRYRLLATSEFGEGEGEARSFHLDPPLAEARTAIATYTEATLRAEVDPEGIAATYSFQYLTQAAYEANGGGFAGAAETPQRALPAGEGLVSLEEPIVGLAEGTSYAFRVLADNAVGEAEALGDPFATLTRPPAQSCPNAAYRTGSSGALPDCRAYELVSPAQTSTPLITASSGSGSKFFDSFWVAPRGPGAGQSVAYTAAFGAVAGADAASLHARRAPGDHPAGGWSSEGAGFTYAQASDDEGIQGVSADQEYWLLKTHGGNTPGRYNFPPGEYLRVPAGTANRACAPEPKASFEASDAAERFELVGCGPLGADPKAEGDFVSAGGDHAIFGSSEELTGESPPTGTEAIYDREAGSAAAELISTEPEGGPFETGDLEYVAATEDGSSVLFKAGGALYAHRDGQSTEVAAEPNTFAGISADGGRVFFIDKAYGGSDKPPLANLYACEVAEGPCAGPGATQAPSEIATEAFFVNVAAGGARALFTSEEALTEPGEVSENGEHAVEGEPNLYLWDEGALSFVALLDPSDLAFFRIGEQFLGKIDQLKLDYVNLRQWTSAIQGQSTDLASRPGRADSPTRSTPDGGAFVFQSHAKLTPYENQGRGEIYRYAPGAPAGQRMLCVSCDETGAPPPAYAYDTFLQLSNGNIQKGFVTDTTLIPNVTDDGRKVFFQSVSPLVPSDANKVNNVYEWRAPGTSGPGGDECARAQGCLALISTGQADSASVLYGMGADGRDAIFETRQRLLGANVPDTFSLYDAREGGGIPEPETPAPCEGDACQGQGAPAGAAPNLPSAGPAEGNLATPAKHARRCAKGKRKIKRKGKTRCVAKHHKHKKSKHRRKHRANSNRRAHR